MGLAEPILVQIYVEQNLKANYNYPTCLNIDSVPVYLHAK